MQAQAIVQNSSKIFQNATHRCILSKVKLLSLVGLQVSMHYAVVVQVLQCQDGLGKVHACHFNR